MTANERFKKRARKYAAEHGVAPAAAARILREQAAQRQAPADQPPSQADSHHGGGHTTSTPADLGVVGAAGQETGPAGAEQQAIVVDLSSLARGSDGKTETSVDLAAMFSNGGAPHVIDVAPLSDARQTGPVKGGRGKSDAAALFAEAMKEISRFEPVLIDIDGLGAPAVPPRPAARQRLAAFLIGWLVKVSGSEDPQQITTWLREHGHALDLAQQLMLEMLLADPELRAGRSALSLSAGADPEQYLGNVIGLICEELDAVMEAQSRCRRSYLDLEQPEPKLADLQVPLPSSLPGGLMQWPSLGAKGGRCAGLPACRVHCTCGGPSGPSTGGAAHLARSFGRPPLDVDELLERKGRGSGPKQTGHHKRRGQR